MNALSKDFQVTAGDINIYHARLIADQQITFVLEFLECLDVDKLVSALAVLHESLPILSTVIKIKETQFQRIRIPNHRPTISLVSDANDLQQEIMYFIGTACDPEREVPLKVHLVRGPDKDILCFKVDHILSDAGGLRYLLSLFAEAYTKGNISQPINHDRGFGQIFHKFSPFTIAKATQTANLPIPGPRLLHGEFGGTNTFIEHVSLPREQFERLKLEGKREQATMNDMLLTALYQAVFQYLDSSEQINYPVMVPVDMRRYLPEQERGVIANLSSAVYPSLTVIPNERFYETLARVKTSMDIFKRNEPGLGPMLLMAMGALFGGSMIRKRYQQAASRGSRFINYTNFGVLEEDRFMFGQATVQQIFGVGPIQYAPGFLIALSTHRRVLHIVVQGKGNEHFQIAIRQFLDAIVCNLLNAENSANGQN